MEPIESLNQQIGERLRTIREEYLPGAPLSASAITDLFYLENAKRQISRESWYNYEKGVTGLSTHVLVKLAEYGVNLNWLYSGEGPILVTTTEVKTLTLEYIGEIRNVQTDAANGKPARKAKAKKKAARKG